jgi:hypothetical protein
MRFQLLPVFLSSLALVACGGSDDGDSVDPLTPIDAGTPVNVDGSTEAICSVSTPTFGDKGALAGGATFSVDPANALRYSIVANSPLEAALPTDGLIVEFYTGYTPFGTSAAPTAVVPGTYQLTDEQLNYASCGVCVRLVTNSAEDGSSEDDYMATGGTVTVSAVGDAVGETLTFALSNLTFEHVTIDGMTYNSTPAGDGCTTTISGATFTGTVAAPAMKRGGTSVRLTRTR